MRAHLGLGLLIPNSRVSYLSNLLLGLGVEGTLFLRDLVSVAHMLSVSATEAPGPGLRQAAHCQDSFVHIPPPQHTSLNSLEDTMLPICAFRKAKD